MTGTVRAISASLSPSTVVPLPAPLDALPRIALVNAPTPLQEALRYSEALGGPRIYLKRDDLTGLATGGNKTRKLEFLIGQALERGADTVVTAGAVQSNHCRQTAAAAARCGLECHLVFGGVEPERPEGNYLLDRLFGVHTHFTERHFRAQKMLEVCRMLEESGRRPYLIPVGGSNAIGALGYVAAMFELTEQLKASSLKIDHIVFATSSGATQAGLIVGAALYGFGGRITGVSIDQKPDHEDPAEKYREFVLGIARDVAKIAGLGRAIELPEVEILYDYLGAGYGVVGNSERDAIHLLAKTEGILTGPVYSGRALGALADLVRRGHFEPRDNVLFWHTGDETTLHAHVEDFFPPVTPR